MPKINRQGPSYEPGKEPYGAMPVDADAVTAPADAEPEPPGDVPVDAVTAATPRKRRAAEGTQPPPPPPAE